VDEVEDKRYQPVSDKDWQRLNHREQSEQRQLNHRFDFNHSMKQT
jgi:hypothetical protein